MIPQKDWKWFGLAGHLIVCDDCLFHLTTQVGNVIVSTVGDWRPAHQRKGEELPPAMDIGYARKYETMVFRAGNPCACGCGRIDHDGRELEMTGYNDAASATRGHLDVCMRWAEQEPPS